MARMYTEAQVTELLYAHYKNTDTYSNALGAWGTEEKVRKLWDDDRDYYKRVRYSGRWNDSMAMRRATIKCEDGVEDDRLIERTMKAAVSAQEDIELMEKLQKLVGSANWHMNKAAREGKAELVTKWADTMKELEEAVKAAMTKIRNTGEIDSRAYYEAQSILNTAKQNLA